MGVWPLVTANINYANNENISSNKMMLLATELATCIN